MPTIRLQPLDEFQGVRKGAGKAVDPNHDERIPGAQLIPHTRQNRPGGTVARGLFLHDLYTARNVQFLDLGAGRFDLWWKDARIR
jgi:hypothetical protein